VPITYFSTNLDNYESGFNFKVDNFAKDVPSTKHAQYIPFSIGRRSCPGKYFAEMTIKIFIVSLVNRTEILPTTEEKGQWILRSGYEMKDLELELKNLQQ